MQRQSETDRDRQRDRGSEKKATDQNTQDAVFG